MDADRHCCSRRVFTAGLLGLSLAPWVAPRRTQAASAYTIVNIGVLEGDDVSFAYAINARGAVTGMSQNMTTGFSHVPYFRREPIRALDTEERSGAGWSINDDGLIAGFVASAAGTQLSAAVVLNVSAESNQMTELPTLGGDSAQAFGINDDGVVVGGANLTAGAPLVACRWDGGVATALPAAAEGSVAIDINSRGQIVGRGVGGQAVLWDGDQAIDLGTLGGTISLARTINRGGQVAGQSTTTLDGQLGQPGNHAFRWEDGVMTDLGTLPGGEISYAWDVNRHGDVAGSAQNPATADNPDLALAAVIWPAGEDGAPGEIVNLNDLLPADSGWVLLSAYGINDKGQIAGVGFLNGERRGFVMTPADE